MKRLLWTENVDGRVELHSDHNRHPLVAYFPHAKEDLGKTIKYANSLMDAYYNDQITFDHLIGLRPPKKQDLGYDTSYYTKYMTEFNCKFLGFVPALPDNNHWSQSYYCIRDRTDDAELRRYSPVLYLHTDKFLFDSEYTIAKYEECLAKYESKRHILFFVGCDDGHVGLRFESKEQALEYYENLVFFEQVFNHPNIKYHN